MKVLFLCDDRPDYTADTLYMAFCALLGDHSVVDYPRKRLYHVTGPAHLPYDQKWNEALWDNSPEHPITPEEVSDTAWDMIVVPSWRQGVRSGWEHVVPRSTPVVLINAEDVPAALPSDTPSPPWPAPPNVFRLQREHPLTPGWDLFPMMFPHQKISWEAWTQGRKDYDIFFGGKPQVRKTWLTKISTWPLRFRLVNGLSMGEYLRHLGRARCGLALRGSGRDTFRLWETIAHARPVLSDYWPWTDWPTFAYPVDSTSPQALLGRLKTVDEPALRTFALTEAIGVARASHLAKRLGLSAPFDPQRTDHPEMEFASRYAYGLGLDVGCGHRKVTRHAVGIDHTPKGQLGRAGSEKGMASLADITRDVADLSMFPDDVFDYVIASHIIEHFEQPETVFREWLRVLRPGGPLVLITPDPAHQDVMAMDGTHRVAVHPKDISRWAQAQDTTAEFHCTIPKWSYGALVRKVKSGVSAASQ